MTPTLREVVAGYERFNTWELEEQRRELPHLTVEESLRQFFELSNLARALAPDADRVFLGQDKIHWIALRERLQRVAEAMGSGRTTS
jgi:hypothetical protein